MRLSTIPIADSKHTIYDILCQVVYSKYTIYDVSYMQFYAIFCSFSQKNGRVAGVYYLGMK